ncbi:MAG: hypothetical protein ACOX52_09025 [Verrucomicrobiota bacterium]
MRARCQPGKGSISISISTRIWLIDNPSYSYSPHCRVRERVPLRCVRVRVRFWAELERAFSGSNFSRLSIALASLASWRFILWGRPLPDELSTWVRFGQRGG